MLTSKKRATRKRRRVGCLKNIVFCTVYQLFLASCKISPKHKYYSRRIIRYCLYNCICKLCPPNFAVGGGFRCPHCKYCVEQEYTLFSPVLQVAVLLYLYSKVALYLLVDILEGWRRRYAVGNRKGEAVGLVGAVVWVLAKDDNLHFAQRCEFKCVEDEAAWRVNCLSCSFFSMKEAGKVLEIFLAELALQLLFPLLLNFYIHL